MTRNVTGGSGHRAQRNSEGAKAKHNRCFVDDLLEDIKNNEKIDDIRVARVLKRMGNGRMEVFFICERTEDEHEESTRKIGQMIVPMRGGLKGKGKKSVWVDIDSIVMVAETGLGGTTHEIVAVFSPEQVARYRKLLPDTDERLFSKSNTAGNEPDVGFEFEDGKEVDVDNI
jgi:hypothetical protein